MPRVDLGPLADELTKLESGGRWEFGGVDGITPAMRFDEEESRAAEVLLESFATNPTWTEFSNFYPGIVNRVYDKRGQSRRKTIACDGSLGTRARSQ
jgi:hypothetical protein